MHRNKIATLAAALAFASNSVWAEEVSVSLTCTFVTECIAGVTCADTSYEMEVDLKEVSKSPFVTVVRGSFSTVSESWDLTGFYKDGNVSVNGGAVFPASHFITINAAGDAIYTTHISADLGITYLGNCG